jgi:hypothetical protein
MIQSIATSSAQNDSGLFTLDFRDERYLPFEGAGVISSWQLQLPETFRSFDYTTISDVIITVNYTSKDGGEILKKGAESHLKEFTENSAAAPLERLFSMKHEFGNEWYRFLNPAEDEDDQQLNMIFKKSHFPYMFHEDNIHVTTMDIILQLKNPSLYSDVEDEEKMKPILIIPIAGETGVILTSNLSPSSDEYLNSQPVNLGLAASFTIEEDDVIISLKASEANLQTIPEALVMEVNGHYRLNTEQVENLFLIVHYYTAEPVPV